MTHLRQPHAAGSPAAQLPLNERKLAWGTIQGIEVTGLAAAPAIRIFTLAGGGVLEH